ncbi:MAG: hypothetical protein ABSD67_05660 [Terracidiphilus sp.]|jgi:hypothetical protein
MLNRRTIWLLAAVMALGTAFVVPSVRAEQGAEVCSVACLAEQQCEQQEMGRETRANADIAPAPICFRYEAPRTLRFKWPASYQRPPTSSL